MSVSVWSFFFFKQKTAYEMRISDWSSDVCSSDLVGGRGGPGPLRLAGLGNQFIDRVDRDLHLLVAEHHRAEHHVFRQLLGFGFDHQHGVGGAGNDELELRVDQLGLGGVEQVLAVLRSEEHTSELQSLMRISYAVFCLKKKNKL